MKRIIALTICLFALFTLCACGAKNEGGQEAVSAPEAENGSIATAEPNEGEGSPITTIEPDYDTDTAVLDVNGERIGSLPENTSVLMTDSGIFYTLVPDGGFGTVEYGLFDPATGEKKLLGSMEKQSYEATYCRTELGGRIYTLAMTGVLSDGEPDTLWLLEFDPAGEMKKYEVEDNGFPYAYMAAVNGKLVIAEHDQQDKLYDRIFEFDPESGVLREVMCFELADGSSVGDTVRALCESDGKLYMLRVNHSQAGVRLYLDTYSFEYEFESERDVTDLIAGSVEYMTGEKDYGEIEQLVSGFFIENGIMYYENFSMTHCLMELESGRQLVEASDLFAASSGSGKHFLVKMYEEGAENVFELEGGELAGRGFEGCKDGYFIIGASASANGDRLIVTWAGAGEGKPVVMYYVHG